MHPMHDDEKLLRSWGRGPCATTELREWIPGKKVIVKKYGEDQSRAMWTEYLALTALRLTHLVPLVIRFMPGQRILVLEWISGVTVLEWVLRKYGLPQAKIEYFSLRKRVKADPEAMQAFEQFKHSTDPGCLKLYEMIRKAYARIHRYHIVHNDVKPANIIIGETNAQVDRIVLVDFERATLRWDAVRRDQKELAFWFGRGFAK